MIIIIACIIGIIISAMFAGHEFIKTNPGGDFFVFIMNVLMLLIFVLILVKTVNI